MGLVEFYDPAVHGNMSDFVHNIIPLAAQEKANGKVRMLVDPTLPGINACMRPLPCPLPTVEEILKHVKPTSVLAKRDLVNGFFHCVLAPVARTNMGFTHPTSHKVGRWVALPQGTKQSPAIFCDVTRAATRIFNRELAARGIKCLIFIYVDDFILIGDTHADIRAAAEIMDHEGALLGLEFNPSKDVGLDAPLQQLEALGIIIDAPKQELQLPESKRLSYLAELQAFQATYKQSDRAPRKVLEKLVGKLVFACRVCKWGYLFVQELLDNLYPGVSLRTSRIPLTEGTWHDTAFWDRVLNTPSLWMGMPQILVDRKDLHIDPTLFPSQIYTDASKVFGVGGMMGTDMFSCPWKQDVENVHIGILELKGLLWSLQHFSTELTGKLVLAWLDNVQAVSAVNKGASRIPAMREILLEIALLGMEHKFQLKAKHIPGKLNPADDPSRGETGGVQVWTFTEAHLFNDPPVQVDCCAPQMGPLATSTCNESYTILDPVQHHIGQIQGKVLWATVPVVVADAVIGACIEAWQRDPMHTVATIVVPDWPSAAWYRRYLRRKNPLLKVLHRYPEGARIFSRQGLANPAPAKWPVLVLRIGTGPHL
jgi:hypothetical protein